MIIDGHAHGCGELYQIEGIKNYLSKYHIDKIVLCPGEHDSSKNYPMPMIADAVPSKQISYGFNKVIKIMTKVTKAASYLDAQNYRIGKIAKENQADILQAYWINPEEYNAVDKMELFHSDYQFCMVKMHQCWHSFDIKSEIIRNIAEWSEKKNCPVFIHLADEIECKKFADIANDYQKTRFIIGHMIGFNTMLPLLKFSNVYFDISAPFMIPMPYLHKAVDMGLSHRLVLGSDTPYGNHNIIKNIKRIDRLKITSKEKEGILGLNLLDIIKQ